jgi:YHS domain-containing protein/thiol-disulfide isomerase/thioredoxin
MLDRPTRAIRAAACAGLGLACLLLVMPPSRGDDGRAIPWRPEFERAMAEARAAGRPLWVQFTGPWCGYCRRMEHEVFTRPEVAGLARARFVPVLVQADDREDLVARFAVAGLPATIVLSPSGAVLARHEGFADASAFRALLDQALAKAVQGAADAPALAGYCPVCLVRGRGLTPGRPELSLHYDGRAFRFAEAADRDAFLKEPEAFLPALGGRCPVRQLDRGESVPGDPRFGVYYRGRLYLCADEPARQRFARDPSHYCDADLADRGDCPHCRRSGRSVPGRPQFAATRDGRRYLFPDRQHLEAFRASPEVYLR